MALIQDRCICLRKTEYSETSQILMLFAREHGIVRVLAKGAHRRTKAGASKFDGGVDLLDVGQAVFTHSSERNLNTLCEWSLQNGNRALRATLRGLYLGLYSAELTSMLIEEHDPHPELFDRLEQSLQEFSTPRQEEAFLAFQLDLLRETGYLGQLTHCSNCGSALGEREVTFFSPASGGVVCRNCESTVPDRVSLDLRLIRLMQGILKLPRTNGAAQRLPRLTRHQTDPLNRLFADQVEHTLGRRLRLPGYVLGR
jgi:DNA repair protein RecO (recombination protein O)